VGIKTMRGIEILAMVPNYERAANAIRRKGVTAKKLDELFNIGPTRAHNLKAGIPYSFSEEFLIDVIKRIRALD
jgi:hypothetical protein